MKKEKQQQGTAREMTLEIHPGHAAEFQKLHKDLYPQLNAAQQEVQRLETIVASLRTEGGLVGSLTAEAAALLSGNNEKPDAKSANEQLQKAKHRLAVVKRAVELQQQIVQRQLTAASRMVCEAVEPEYKSVVEELGRALIAFGVAVEKELELRSRIRETGANWLLPVMGFVRLGLPTDTESILARWLREAVVIGYLDRREIPASWLKVWGVYVDAEIADRKARLAQQPAKPALAAPRPGVDVAYTM